VVSSVIVYFSLGVFVTYILRAHFFSSQWMEQEPKRPIKKLYSKAYLTNLSNHSSMLKVLSSQKHEPDLNFAGVIVGGTPGSRSRTVVSILSKIGIYFKNNCGRAIKGRNTCDYHHLFNFFQCCTGVTNRQYNSIGLSPKFLDGGLWWQKNSTHWPDRGLCACEKNCVRRDQGDKLYGEAEDSCLDTLFRELHLLEWTAKIKQARWGIKLCQTIFFLDALRNKFFIEAPQFKNFLFVISMRDPRCQHDFHTESFLSWLSTWFGNDHMSGIIRETRSLERDEKMLYHHGMLWSSIFGIALEYLEREMPGRYFIIRHEDTANKKGFTENIWPNLLRFFPDETKGMNPSDFFKNIMYNDAVRSTTTCPGKSNKQVEELMMQDKVAGRWLKSFYSDAI
jgi:hypothetical protein